MTIRNKKKQKGSILAYSLIIISVMLTIGATLSVSMIIEKKSAVSVEASMQALQTADAGIQLALKKINIEIVKTLPGTIDNAFSPNCSGSAVLGNIDGGPVGSGAVYDLYFYAKNSNIPLSCTDPVKNIAKIKSVGKYKNTVRATDVGVSDPFTKLLLHGDGGGSSIKDDSPQDRTSTVSGVTQVGSSPPGSFSNSMKFSSGDYLTFQYSSDFDFGMGDMTIEAWINADTSTATNAVSQTIIAKWKDGGIGDFRFGIIGGAKLAFYSGAINENDGSPVVQSVNPVPINTWTHVAIVKKGNVYTLYINGIAEAGTGTVTNATPFRGNAASVKISIGKYMDSSSNFSKGQFIGNIDELRVSKGVARWVDPIFPLPTAAY